MKTIKEKVLKDELERLIDKMLDKKKKMSGRDFIKLVFLSGWGRGKQETLTEVRKVIDKEKLLFPKTATESEKILMKQIINVYKRKIKLQLRGK